MQLSTLSQSMIMLDYKNDIYNNKLTQWPFNKIVSLGHDKQDSFVFEQDVHVLGLLEHNWHTPVDVK